VAATLSRSTTVTAGAAGGQLTGPPLPPQERKSVAASGLELQRLSGDAITPGTWDAFYRFYRNTTGLCSVVLTASVCAWP